MTDVADQAALIGSNDEPDESNVDQFLAAASTPATPAAEAPVSTPQATENQGTITLAEMNALLDKRLSGFQRLLSEKDQAIADREAKLREFQVAGMSEDERTTLAQRERDEELERLRQENALYQLRDTFPDEVPLYMRLMKAATAEEQLAILREARTPAEARQAVADATAAAQTPQATVPVLPNNPRHSLPADSVVLSDGTVMNDEIADNILRGG